MSPLNEPLVYGNYPTVHGTKDLAIVIKNRFKNSYGTGITIWIDHIKILIDREEAENAVRYYEIYEMQLMENNNFDNHLFIFGQKHIDNKIIRAIHKRLKKTEDDSPPQPLRLVRVSLKGKIDEIMKSYPNLQHFCIKDILEERTKDIVVKGNMLEETDLYERFVKDEEISGNVNFLGIRLEHGKIIYVGSDGSVFSRFTFKGDEKIRVVYDLYSKFKRLNAIQNSLHPYIHN